jgi:hypothetical protein
LESFSSASVIAFAFSFALSAALEEKEFLGVVMLVVDESGGAQRGEHLVGVLVDLDLGLAGCLDPRDI